jgi:hypothetical protein
MTFKITEETLLHKLRRGDPSEIKDGDLVLARGKLNQDMSSIRAARLIISPYVGAPGVNTTEVFDQTVTGTAKLSGDSLTIDAGGKVYAVQFANNLVCLFGVEASGDDIRVGDNADMTYRDEGSDTKIAVRVGLTGFRSSAPNHQIRARPPMESSRRELP